MTSQQAGESTLLHVAHPSKCNPQQTPLNNATTGATALQHTSLKALALLALGRNNTRNNVATNGEKTAQQTAISSGAFVARVLPDSDLRTRLQQLAAEEGIDAERIHTLDDDGLAGCEGLSDHILRAYVRGLRDSDLREHGKVPADETAAAMCKHCGPVFVATEVASVAPFVDGWPRLLGCPWCHVKNRNFQRPNYEE